MNRSGRSLTSLLFAAGIALTAPARATAGPIGTLQIASGAATYSATGLQLQNSTAVPATGIFVATSGSQIGLSDVTFGSGGPLVTSFVVLPNVTISGTFATGVFSSASCGAAPAAGQQCTPSATSPLNFYNTDNGSVASVSLNLAVSDGFNTLNGSGIITMQFADQSYQQVLSTLASGGTIPTSYSAQFNAGTAGSFSFGGSLGLSSTGLDFTPTTTVGSVSNGQFRVMGASDGTFQALGGTTGLASDLPDGTQTLTDFLTFAIAPNLSFDLSALETGVFSQAQCFAAPAAAQSCTPPVNSPYEFVNLANGSVFSFNVDGTMTDLTGSSFYEGVYSMQFLGLSYQQVLDQVSRGGSVTALYSATFETRDIQPVPEPTSLLLMGTGVAAAFVRRRRSMASPRSVR